MQWSFAKWSCLLPLKRLFETDETIVFYHPRPFWHTHLLLVPKHRFSDLQHLQPNQYSLVYGILQLAVRAIRTLELLDSGFLVLVNGGKYQDVGQLHFHLAIDTLAAKYNPPDSVPKETLLNTNLITAFHHPHPYRTTHIIIQPKNTTVTLLSLTEDDRNIIGDVIFVAINLVEKLNLLSKGYTLLTVYNPNQTNARFCFHLVSGGTVAP